MIDIINLSVLEETLGHSFKDKNLLTQALTHPSIATQRTSSFERLEFLGDRVLGLVMAHWLWQHYPQSAEGQLTRRHASLVGRISLNAVSTQLNLSKFIKRHPSHTSLPASITANSCEALIGAVFVDAGYDTARQVIETLWKSLFMAQDSLLDVKDPKMALQEWLQAQGHPLPRYELTSKTGPDHAPRFHVHVYDSKGHFAEGYGSSRLCAEKRAATTLLQTLQENKT